MGIKPEDAIFSLLLLSSSIIYVHGLFGCCFGFFSLSFGIVVCPDIYKLSLALVSFLNTSQVQDMSINLK